MRVSVFGGGFDTMNLGVSALTQSAIEALWRSDPRIRFLIFDHTKGRAPLRLQTADGEIACERQGGLWTRRVYRSDSLAQIKHLSRFGGLWSRSAREFSRSAAVLDVSGGDSFSDIYGEWRFHWMMMPKLMAIELDLPLILLPQTYGPYTDPKLKGIAAQAVRGADMCWARDERSFAILQDLLGDAFDADRHRCGVDLAFGLEPRDASDALSNELRAMLDADRTARPLVGFNISGLIYHDPAKAVSRYRFKADYRRLLEQFLSGLLDSTDANLVLIPHVMRPPEHWESDPGACEAVAESLRAKYPAHAGRVLVSPRTLDQCQVKWLIAQTDWFCGTRMHSTIAALSSGVPTATVSYSDKAKGVFETCGQGEQVIDPRELDTGEVVSRLKASFESRATAKVSLAEHLPAVKAKAAEQMDAVAERIRLAVSRRGKAAG